jgi:HEAT repeat protein
MKTRLFGVFVIVVLGLAFTVSSAWAKEKKIYQTLLPKGSSAPHGHIIVQVPKTRKAPTEWNMGWFVSTYTPKGYRLFLGMIKDTVQLGKESKMVLKVPCGTYKIEITRLPDVGLSQKKGFFDIEKGEWVPPNSEPVYIENIYISIKPDQIKLIEINYENPRVHSKSEKKDRKKILYTWENFRLLERDGENEILPPGKPRVYSLIKYAAFEDIDQSHLIEALKENNFSPAFGALLNIKELDNDLVISALKNKPLKLTASFGKILVKARDKRAVDVLIKILEDGPENMRYIAAWTLGEIGDNRAAEALRKALKGQSIIVRNYSVNALAKIKDQRAVDTLVEATKDNSCLDGFIAVPSGYEIPRKMFWKKGMKGWEEALPIPHWCIRNNAIYALGRIGDIRALDTLLNLINDPEDIVRFYVIGALSNYKDIRVTAALIDALKHSGEARWLAVQVLAKIGDDKALAPLLALSRNDTDEMVREAAKQAVEKIRKANR